MSIETKTHKSHFVPDLDIDVCNFIAEMITRNKLLNWKKPLPTCPFWQNIYQSDPKIKALTKDYYLELTEARNLLKVFSASVIIECFKELKLHTLRYLKKENKMEVIYNLYGRQLKAMKELKEDKALVELSEDKTIFFQESAPAVSRPMASKNKINL